MMLSVKSVEDQTDDTSTLKIGCPIGICEMAKPGQFFMVWIPRVDEIPMSISNVEKGEIWITVKEVGEATSAVRRIGEGGQLGLRGPYGTSFSAQGNNVLIVAGGIGAAPLLFLTRTLLGTKRKITLVLGAKTVGKLVLRRDFEKLLQVHRSTRQIVTTDDGSLGTKGYASDIAIGLMRTEKFDRVYTCGPELMMQKIINSALDSGARVEACLERYMRCGIGLCGSCYLGKYLVCKDGPVFPHDKIREIVKYLKAE
jgi:dihydroorotate dehydrogenase electron transfer subunit